MKIEARESYKKSVDVFVRTGKLFLGQGPYIFRG